MPALLFTPYKMRDLEIENRIVLSPMCQYAAEEGKMTDWHIMHLGQYACSNIGLIIAEATGVEPRGRISPWCVGLYNDETQAAMARVVKHCKSLSSSKFGVQLAHAGRKSPISPSFMMREIIPVDRGGWVPLCPSDYRDESHPVPHVMTRADIEECKRFWVDATRRAAEIVCTVQPSPARSRLS